MRVEDASLIPQIRDPARMLKIPCERRSESLIKCMFRTPSEFAADFGSIYAVAPVVPWPILHKNDPLLFATTKMFKDSFCDSPIAHLIACADIVDFPRFAAEKAELKRRAMVLRMAL